jgi:hypothetical protein
MPFKGYASLSRVIPLIQRRIAVVALTLFMLFTLIVAWRMVTTSFRLTG